MEHYSSTVCLSSSEALATESTTETPRPNSHTIHKYTSTTSKNYAVIEYLLYLPTIWSADNLSKVTTQPCPIILFLHGAGEVNKGKVLCRSSSGRKSLVQDGAWRLRTVPGMLPSLVDQIVTTTTTTNADTSAAKATFPFIVISPQCPKGVRFGSSTDLMDDLREIITNTCHVYNGDVNNIFVTGLSMGGYGTWSIASRHGNFFKAAAPICGGFKEFHENLLTLKGLWCFHGANDTIIPVTQSDIAINRINKAIEMTQTFGNLFHLNQVQEEVQKEGEKKDDDNENDEIRIDVKYTRYEKSPSPSPNMIGHGSWIQAYYESNLFQWFQSLMTTTSSK
jgi:predicted peptidase